MKDIRVSTGIWFLGATSDRFVKQGYRDDRTIEERFKLAATIPGGERPGDALSDGGHRGDL